MLLPLLSSLALAAPPSGVDLEDYSAWARAADQLLDGPPGCYEVVGRATWAWDLGRFGYNRGDAIIVGRLHDGAWSGLRAITLGEVAREGQKPARRKYTDELRVAPMLGRVEEVDRKKRKGADAPAADPDTGPTGSAEAVNLVRRALDEITGDVEVAWATWEPTVDAVVLHRQVEVGGGRNPPPAIVRTRFPGGRTAPDGLEVVFPEKWRTDSFPSAAVSDASVQIRAEIHDGVAFPRSEAVRMTASVLGFTFSGAQTIAYRSIVPCDEAGRKGASQLTARVDAEAQSAEPADPSTGAPEPTLAVPEVPGAPDAADPGPSDPDAPEPPERDPDPAADEPSAAGREPGTTERD